MKNLSFKKQVCILYDYLYTDMLTMDICKKYRINTTQLYRCMKDNDIKPNRNQPQKPKYLNAINDYINSELTIEEICKKYNINYNTLYYNLKLYNQKPSKHTRKREKYDDIINDYQNLISIKDIAKKYNLCEGQIRRILHENNIELRSKKLEASENQKKVMNMLINEGLSQAEVARRLNVSRQCISKLYLKCKEKNIQW